MENILITNCNRDRAKIWFEHKEGNYYTIHSDKDFVLKYAGCNYDKLPDDAEEFDFEMPNPYDNERTTIKGHYISYDPAGGPYLSIGSKIGDKTLKRIFNKNDNFLFELI